MIPQNLIATLSSILANHPLLSLGVAIVLVIFLWKKPWEFLKFALMVALLIGGIYFSMQLGSSAKYGAKSKHTMATETEEKMSGN